MNYTIEKKNHDIYLMFICFYIFVTPLRFSNSQDWILTSILFIWGVVKYEKEFIKKSLDKVTFLPLFLLLMFFMYKYISILWSDNLMAALKHAVNSTKYYFLFMPVLLFYLNKKSAFLLIKIIIVSFGVYAIYSISIYLGIFNIQGSSMLNPKGYLRYLIVCQYMSIGFFCATLISYYSKVKNEKFFFSVVAILCFITLFINNSRTAQLSFLFVLLIFFIIFFKKYIFSFKALLLFFIIIFSGIYFLYENNKLGRFEQAYNETKEVFKENKFQGSFGVRLYFNKVGIEIFKDNFFFGTGTMDNKELLREEQRNDPNYNGKIYNQFHSEHMDTLTAYGIIGYSLLFFSIVFLIYSLRKQELYYYMSMAVFLTLFFNSFANETLAIRPLNYIYILFFLFFTIISLNVKRQRSS